MTNMEKDTHTEPFRMINTSNIICECFYIIPLPMRFMGQFDMISQASNAERPIWTVALHA